MQNNLYPPNNESVAIPPYFSKTISQLRFPMAIMVVAIHWNAKESSIIRSCLPTADSPFPSLLYSLYVNILNIAVPLFFIFSGYLMFAKRRNSPWGAAEYKKTLKSRFYTLAIPYLIWNFFAIVLNLFKPLALGKGWEACQQNFSVLHPLGLLKALWIDSQYCGAPWPTLVPLWFIRELIVMTVLAPVFYIAFRTVGSRMWQGLKIVLFLCVIYMMYASGLLSDEYGISFRAILCFSFGIIIALKRLEGHLERHALLIAPLLLVTACFLSCYAPPSVFGNLFSALRSLLGALCLLVFMLKCFIRGDIPNCFAQSAMFVFCWHSLPIIGGISIASYSLKLLHLSPECASPSIVLLYVIMPPIIISITAMFIYLVCKRFFPRTMRILVGR